MSSTHFEITLSKTSLFVAGCIAAGVVMGASTLASVHATSEVLGTNDSPSTNLIMPYDGTIERDGSPVTRDDGVRINFQLYDAASGGTLVWEEEQLVKIYGGRFSVGLGSSVALTDDLLDAEQVWLSMTLINPDGTGSNVALDGRQAIEPAPFAAWTGNASPFNVAGNLTIQETDVTVSGVTRKSATTLGGPLVTQSAVTASGTDNDGSDSVLTISSSGSTMRIDGNEVDSTSTIHLQQNSGAITYVEADLVVLDDTAFGDGFTGTTTINGPASSSSAGALRVHVEGTTNMYLGGNGINMGNGRSLQLNTNNNNPISIGEDLLVDGAYKPSYDVWDGTTGGDGGAVIVNDNGTYDALVIRGNNSGGDHHVKMYNDVYVNDQLSVNNATTFLNDVDVNANVTVTGTMTRSTECPGSPWVQVYSAFGGKRLCAYREIDNRNWNGSADQCWYDYGAELCTYNQMRIALTQGTGGLSQNSTYLHWMRDMIDDDAHLLTNGEDESNFDGWEDRNTTERGAFCCLMLSDR